jgi:pimeloyl-ACP methyl ester carboxylesterase
MVAISWLRAPVQRARARTFYSMALQADAGAKRSSSSVDPSGGSLTRIDYPGFGQSSAPSVAKFDYTFDKIANVMEAFTEKVGLKTFSLYVQDYGAPVGYRLAVKHPERVIGLVVQNGNAYEEGLDNDFWKPLKAYWKNRTEENAAPLRKFLTLEATKW